MKRTGLGLWAAAGLAAVLMLGGCATTSEVEKLRADVQQASSAANSAQQTADAAMSAIGAAQLTYPVKKCCDFILEIVLSLGLQTLAKISGLLSIQYPLKSIKSGDQRKSEIMLFESLSSKAGGSGTL